MHYERRVPRRQMPFQRPDAAASADSVDDAAADDAAALLSARSLKSREAVIKARRRRGAVCFPSRLASG